MELYRGIPTEIKLDVPANPQQAYVEFFLDDEQVGTIVQPDVTGNIATVTPPYAAVERDGLLKVVFTFVEGYNYYNKEFFYDVVTPYLQLHEIGDILGSTSTTTERINLERAVRLVIDAYTGQTFGYRYKELVIRGRDINPLVLPERLVSFESLSAPDWTPSITETDGFLIQEDGFNLRRVYTGTNVYNTAVYTNPIRYPFAVYGGTYKDYVEYHIKGWWGHKTVPTAVAEAAKLLANDYACSEVMYRDRKLISMTAADWRFQFASSAFAGTGNVRADQLLSDYIRTGWAVI